MIRIRISGAALSAAIAILLLSTSVSTQGQRRARFEVEIVNSRETAAREVLVKLREPFRTAQLGPIVSTADPDAVEAIGRSGIFRVRSGFLLHHREDRRRRSGDRNLRNE